MSMYHMHAWCLWKQEKYVRSPGTKVTDGCELPSECRELNRVLAVAASAFNYGAISPAQT